MMPVMMPLSFLQRPEIFKKTIKLKKRMNLVERAAALLVVAVAAGHILGLLPGDGVVVATLVCVPKRLLATEGDAETMSEEIALALLDTGATSVHMDQIIETITDNENLIKGGSDDAHILIVTSWPSKEVLKILKYYAFLNH